MFLSLPFNNTRNTILVLDALAVGEHPSLSMSLADSDAPSLADNHGRLVPFNRRTLSDQSQSGHQVLPTRPGIPERSGGDVYPVTGQSGPYIGPQRLPHPPGSHYRSFSEPVVSASLPNGDHGRDSHLAYPVVPAYSFIRPQLGPQPVTPLPTGYPGPTPQLLQVAHAPHLFPSPSYLPGSVIPVQGLVAQFPNGYDYQRPPVSTRQLMSSNDMAAGFQRTSGDARRYITTNPVRTENRPPMNGVLCRNGPQCRKYQEGSSSLCLHDDIVNLQLTGTCNFNHDFSSASVDLLGA